MKPVLEHDAGTVVVGEIPPLNSGGLIEARGPLRCFSISNSIPPLNSGGLIEAPALRRRWRRSSAIPPLNSGGLIEAGRT